MATAIITGASRGIGAAIAKKLASNDFQLALVSRNKKNLDLLKKDIEQQGAKAITIAANLEESSAPERIINETIKAFGCLDLIINNAGLAVTKELEQTSTQTWDKIMQINAKAPYFIIQYALPYLRKSSQPTIINIASVVARVGYINQSAYAASKHALIGFSKSLSKEIQKDDIRLHVLAPGGVDTDMIREMRPDIDASKLIQAEEIAELVEFLITHRGNAMIDNINIRRVNSTPWA